MALIPERIFEQFLLSESEPLLPLVKEEIQGNIQESQETIQNSQGDVEMDQQQRFGGQSGQSSQNSQTPMLGDANLDGDSQESPRQFETLQNCQPNQQQQPHFHNEDSQQSNFENWACEDFDLFEFIGQDDQQSELSGGASQNGDPYSQQQFEATGKEGQDDYMYSIMQYNDLAVGHDNNQPGMYGGLNDMSNGFLQDSRYQNSSTSSILDSTINKLHQQQQLQNQNQPSTSRLSNVPQQQQQQTPQQSYAGRMRPQIATQLGQQPQINADLAENVLLPTSSTSPQNSSMFMNQQTLVKTEPVNNYEMNGEYFDSTSDTESHYSHGARSLTTPSAKPRKYRIKPECERLNPQYRMKRAKNNDAVRRSREKAKQQQVEKEKRLGFLESEHNEHYKTINAYKQRIRELEAENMALRKNCNCGSAQQFMRR